MATTETKQQKLIKLANARVEKALRAIALVGNLASYDPTPQQVSQIAGALTGAVENTIKRFTPKAETSKGFTLTT